MTTPDDKAAAARLQKDLAALFPDAVQIAVETDRWADNWELMVKAVDGEQLKITGRKRELPRAESIAPTIREFLNRRPPA